jgi:hypothetical protein
MEGEWSPNEKVITVFVLQFLQARISDKDFCARQPDGGLDFLASFGRIIRCPDILASFGQIIRPGML